jgi:large subunit ribosomal protein L32e
MAPSVLPHKKIVKKRNIPFPRYQSDEFVKVKSSWRRPRGIDSRHRCKAKGLTKTVKIGYGSDKETRHRMPSGFYKFTVSNTKQLDVLLMQSRKCVAAPTRAHRRTHVHRLLVWRQVHAAAAYVRRGGWEEHGGCAVRRLWRRRRRPTTAHRRRRCRQTCDAAAGSASADGSAAALTPPADLRCGSQPAHPRPDRRLASLLRD